MKCKEWYGYEERNAQARDEVVLSVIEAVMIVGTTVLWLVSCFMWELGI